MYFVSYSHLVSFGKQNVLQDGTFLYKKANKLF